MGYIKEPKGIDFIVESTPPTSEDKKMISEIIAYYRVTGKKPGGRTNKLRNAVKKTVTA